jgi:D-alanine-D-alanine ligase
MSKPRRLLLAFGGRSSEHEISVRSAHELRGALPPGMFELVLVGIGRDGTLRTAPGDWTLADVIARGEPVADLRALRADVVFPLLHGPYGEDGCVQGMLEMLGLPYVGSGVLASALCMDKAALKHYLAGAAPTVPLVPWCQIDAPRSSQLHGKGWEERIGAELGYPCFVKPANMGSSVGVEKVRGATDLAAALERAARFDPKIVVERAVDAREIEVAVLGNGGEETTVSRPGEILLPPDTWYDYATKYENDVAGYAIPATLAPATAAALQQAALTAFRAAGCRGLARVDFFVDRRDGRVYLNEINTMPGFTTISMYPKMMAEAGIDYATLVERLCDLALAAHATRAELRTDH